MQDVNHQLFSDSVWNECELAQPDCPPERIEEILRSFDLLDFKDRHPMALSGGQKQRLAVATAILSDKDVLVFDEPTSGLDYHRMLEVSDMIRKLNDENKLIIIVVHNHHTSVLFYMNICSICILQRFTSVVLYVTLWKKGGNLYGISKMSSMQQRNQ